MEFLSGFQANKKYVEICFLESLRLFQYLELENLYALLFPPGFSNLNQETVQLDAILKDDGTILEGTVLWQTLRVW